MNKLHQTTLIGVYTYVISTIIWAILCVVTDEFTERDKGLVSGFGFLMIFAISIFLANDKIKLRQLVYSIVLIPILFLIASFIVGLFSMWLSWFLDLPEFSIRPLFIILSTLSASLGLGLIIKYVYNIDRFKKTTLLVFIAGIISNLITELIDDILFFDFNISPRVIMFTVWQSIILIPILYLINKNNMNKID